MKILNCPLNGPRNILEFSYGGEFHPMPDPSRCGSKEWAEYIYFAENQAGLVTEWWYHLASSYWFLAQRNTITDEIVRTFEVNEVFSERVEFSTQPEGDQNNG